MKMRIAVLAATVLIASSAWADTWTSAVTMSALQPLVDQEGGVVRVYLTSNISTSCGNTNIFDFVFTNGVAAANSALVAGLYVALNNGTAVTFLLATSCSPFSAPMITGMSVGPP
jgi:hypothetical protein